MSNTAQCNCKVCGKYHEINIDDRSLCDSCFLKSLIKDGYKPKTWWAAIKRFSYIALLTIPLFFTVRMIFGWQVELIVILTLFLGQCLSGIVDWLSEKF